MKNATNQQTAGRARNKKNVVEELNSRTLKEFSKYDSERCGSLDVLQIKRLIFDLYNIDVQESAVKSLVQERSLGEDSTRLKMKDFGAFKTLLETKKNELIKYATVHTTIDPKEIHAITQFKLDEHQFPTNVVGFTNFQNCVIKSVYSSELRATRPTKSFDKITPKELFNSQRFEDVCNDFQQRIQRLSVQVQPLSFEPTLINMFECFNPNAILSDITTTYFNPPLPNTKTKILIELNKIDFDIGFNENLLVSLAIYNTKKLEKVTENVYTSICNGELKKTKFLAEVHEMATDDFYLLVRVFRRDDGNSMMVTMYNEGYDVNDAKKRKKQIEAISKCHTKDAEKFSINSLQQVGFGKVKIPHLKEQVHFENLGFTSVILVDENSLFKELRNESASLIAGRWSVSFEPAEKVKDIEIVTAAETRRLYIETPRTERVVVKTPTKAQKSKIQVEEKGTTMTWQLKPIDSTQSVSTQKVFEMKSLVFDGGVDYVATRDLKTVLYLTINEIVMNRERKLNVTMEISLVNAVFSEPIEALIFPNYSLSPEKRVTLNAKSVGKIVPFNREIRIELPTPPAPNLVLMIKMKDPNESVSFIKLFGKNCETVDSECVQKINVYKGSGEKFFLESFEGKAPSKRVLNVRLSSMGLMYPRLRIIHSVLNSSDKMVIQNGIKLFSEMDNIIVTPYAAVILDRMFEMATLIPINLYQPFLEKFLSAVEVRPQILVDYMNTHFNPKELKIDASVLAEEILNGLLSIFEDFSNDECPKFKLSFFYLQAFVKTVLTIPNYTLKNEKLIEKRLLTLLSLIAFRLDVHVAKRNLKGVFEVNLSIVEFIRDLYSVMDIQFVRTAMDGYYQTLCVNNSVKMDQRVDPSLSITFELMRLDFLSGLKDYPLVVELSTLGMSDTNTNISDVCFQQRFLATFLVYQTLHLVLFHKGDIRVMASLVLLELIQKLDVGRDYQISRSKSAEAFFSIIVILVDEFDSVKKWANEVLIGTEKADEFQKTQIFGLRAIFLCFFFILNEVSYEQKQQYIKISPPATVVKLLHLFHIGQQLFQGNDHRPKGTFGVYDFLRSKLVMSLDVMNREVLTIRSLNTCNTGCAILLNRNRSASIATKADSFESGPKRKRRHNTTKDTVSPMEKKPEKPAVEVILESTQKKEQRQSVGAVLNIESIKQMSTKTPTDKEQPLIGGDRKSRTISKLNMRRATTVERPKELKDLNSDEPLVMLSVRKDVMPLRMYTDRKSPNVRDDAVPFLSLHTSGESQVLLDENSSQTLQQSTTSLDTEKQLISGNDKILVSHQKRPTLGINNSITKESPIYTEDKMKEPVKSIDTKSLNKPRERKVMKKVPMLDFNRMKSETSLSPMRVPLMNSILPTSDSFNCTKLRNTSVIQISSPCNRLETNFKPLENDTKRTQQSPDFMFGLPLESPRTRQRRQTDGEKTQGQMTPRGMENMVISDKVGVDNQTVLNVYLYGIVSNVITRITIECYQHHEHNTDVEKVVNEILCEMARTLEAKAFISDMVFLGIEKFLQKCGRNVEPIISPIIQVLLKLVLTGNQSVELRAEEIIWILCFMNFISRQSANDVRDAIITYLFHNSSESKHLSTLVYYLNNTPLSRLQTMFDMLSQQRNQDALIMVRETRICQEVQSIDNAMFEGHALDCLDFFTEMMEKNVAILKKIVDIKASAIDRMNEIKMSLAMEFDDDVKAKEKQMEKIKEITKQHYSNSVEVTSQLLKLEDVFKGYKKMHDDIKRLSKQSIDKIEAVRSQCIACKKIIETFFGFMVKTIGEVNAECIRKGASFLNLYQNNYDMLVKLGVTSNPLVNVTPDELFSLFQMYKSLNVQVSHIKKKSMTDSSDPKDQGNTRASIAKNLREMYWQYNSLHSYIKNDPITPKLSPRKTEQQRSNSLGNGSGAFIRSVDGRLQSRRSSTKLTISMQQKIIGATVFPDTVFPIESSQVLVNNLPNVMSVVKTDNVLIDYRRKNKIAQELLSKIIELLAQSKEAMDKATIADNNHEKNKTLLQKLVVLDEWSSTVSKLLSFTPPDPNDFLRVFLTMFNIVKANTDKEIAVYNELKETVFENNDQKEFFKASNAVLSRISSLQIFKAVRDIRTRSALEDQHEVQRKEYAEMYKEFSESASICLSTGERSEFKHYNNAKETYQNMTKMHQTPTVGLNRYVEYKQGGESMEKIFQKLMRKGLSRSSDGKPQFPLVFQEDPIGYTLTDLSSFLVAPIYVTSCAASTKMVESVRSVANEILAVSLELQNFDEMRGKNTVNDLTERYLGLAEKYRASPLLHLLWIDNIIKKQIEIGNFLEAGICEIQVVYYVYRVIQGTDIGILDMKNLINICGDFLIDKKENNNNNNTYPIEFTKDLFLTHAYKALEMFAKARMTWYGLEACEMLVNLFDKNRNYNGLATVHESISIFLDNYVDGKSQSPRYYLVVIGELFYVYTSMLSEKEFNEQFKQTCEECGYEFEEAQEVFPVINGEEQTVPLPRITNTNTFSFEMVDEECGDLFDCVISKRIVKTKMVLPSGMQRSIVIGQVDEEITPLSYAIDVINKIVESLSFYICECGKNSARALKAVSEMKEFVLSTMDSTGVFSVLNIVRKLATKSSCDEVDDDKQLKTNIQRLKECYNTAFDNYKMHSQESKKEQIEFEKQFVEFGCQFEQLISNIED
ncbi:hypothetical protein EIN_154570 [Entamoeba invadens IP1]|uniref:DOCKER domain-containing protein n=1 Tax=Entamoeba invadens IP1 TaxID=370355 RepID=A0A0A1U904_ENTIV|nr:hypothetical protein EIN_154570 [Entamoeba invadens IP1]ELP91390.1 hypothetical protein EIN_154570 [Entamoeba invadens IP1]|eukprot:XP_004258161.1 hypothetical protein EIN_154570 [Entamoeba invadens IP1]